MFWFSRWKGKAFLWGMLVFFGGACGNPSPDPPSLPSSIKEGYFSPSWDSLAKTLLTGDLIFRTGHDMTSFMLRQLNLRDKRYSHCGMVRMEDGYPFIYHSIGGEDNPQLALRRDSFVAWVRPARNVGSGVYRLPLDSLVRAEVGDQTLHYYEMKIPFDMRFDLSTDDRFYCAEFIYKTLRHAQKGKWDIPLSLFRGYAFIGIDDLYLNADGHWIWELEYK